MSKRKNKKKNKQENKVFKTIRIIKNAIFAVILVALTAIVVLTVVTRISGKTPSIMGYTIYRVSSGSMVPTFKVGDIILCKDCDPIKLKKGDIITYDGTTGQFAGKCVTHRVVKEPYKKGGEYLLVTKGDDNPVEDTPIKTSQVTGKFQTKVEVLKSLYGFFITPWGLLIMILLILLAFSNEIIIFVRALIGHGDKKKVNIEEIIEKYEAQKTEENSEKSSDTETGAEPEDKDGNTSETEDSEAEKEEEK